MPKPMFFVTVLAVFSLILAACGGDDDTPVPQATSTPQPTATPLDVGAITSALQDTIRSTVDNALAGITPSEGLSASQINRIVEAAVTAAIPDTASAEEISALVETAVAASVTPGLSADEITSLVSSAVAEATAGQADPLTAAEVEAIVTSAIAGIPTATPQPTSTAAPTPTPIDLRRGGILNAQMGWAVGHWGVHECQSSNNCLTPTAPLYNGLLEYNPETLDIADIRGDLATDWSLAADGLNYTFNLHPDAKWHDGTPVTSEDVVFSLDSMVNPDRTRPNASRIAAFYDSSRAIDPLTVEVTTKFKAAPFVSFLATEWMKIIPKARFETLPEDDARLEANVLGSGPFMLKNHESGVVVEYVRNPNYFKEDRPFLDGMNYFTIIDGGSIVAAIKSEQVLTHAHPSSNLSNADNERLAEDRLGKGTVHFAGPIGIIWTHMNHNVAPFDDVRVRRALILANHRQPIIQFFSNGRDQLGAPFQPGSWFGLTEAEIAELPGFRELNGEKHPDDIAEAKRLLAEAGVQPGANIALQAMQVVEFPDLAVVVAEQFRTLLDLDITIDAIELGAGFGKVLAGDYELNILGYGPMITDPHDIMGGAYIAAGRNNFSNWSNPRIEEIFTLQAEELDLVKRRAMTLEVQDIVLQESVFISHYWTMRGMYVDNRIRNFNPPPTDSHALKMEHIWCDPAC